MQRFRYKAVSPDGEVIEGETEAASRDVVIEGLRQQGVFPIRAEPTRRGRARGPALSFAGRRRISPKAVVHFTREMSILIQAALPLDRTLSTLIALTPPGRLRSVGEDLLARVQGGSTLAEALEAHPTVFPAFYAGMVQAGEAGSALGDVLENLADLLERREDLKDHVKSALTYPMLILIMTGLSLVVLMTLVVPEFRPLFEEAGAELPWPTLVIIAISDFPLQYGWALLLAMFLALLGLRRQLQRPEGRLAWDRWLIRLPLFGDLVPKVEVARFARVLGAMLQSGVSLLNALTLAGNTLGNRAVAAGAEGIKGPVAKGEGLAGPMEQTAVFPGLAVQLVRVGEESGRLDAMLLKVADIFEVEVRRSVQRLLSLLVPLITIALGLIVAAVIGSMLAAILSSYDLPL